MTRPLSIALVAVGLTGCCSDPRGWHESARDHSWSDAAIYLDESTPQAPWRGDVRKWNGESLYGARALDYDICLACFKSKKEAKAAVELYVNANEREWCERVHCRRRSEL